MSEDIRLVPRWSTREAAQYSGMSQPTVRKYAQLLTQECNYKFETINARGDRRFSDHDIAMIMEIKRLSDETGMDVTNVVKMVYAKYCTSEPDAVQTQSPDDTAIQPYTDDLNAMIGRASHQFWSAAKQEILEDVREVVSDEVKSELEREMEHLKRHFTDEMQSLRQQVAATEEKKKKRWWQHG